MHIYAYTLYFTEIIKLDLKLILYIVCIFPYYYTLLLHNLNASNAFLSMGIIILLSNPLY